jgi:predicted esterase
MTDGRLSFVHRYEPGDRADAPTLLLLHGTGGDENDLQPLGRRLVPNANLLSPRGKVSEHGMPRFFRRMAVGVFDIEDLIARTHELADFVAEAAAAYEFDPTRVIAVGFSNGANIAASLLLLRPGVLAAAVLFKAQVPLVPEETPDLSGTSVFITAGRADELIQPAETERLVDLLREAGADVDVYWHDGGHALTLEEVEAAREWLSRLPLVAGMPGQER